MISASTATGARPLPFSADQVAMLLGAIEQRTGSALPPVVVERTLRALWEAGQRHGASTADALADRIRRLQASDALWTELTAAICVPETYFHRHPEQLDALHPLLAASLAARGGDRQVRVWSAACATGQEAYTLAILIEAWEPGREVLVLGTDIQRASLEHARAGRYAKSSVRGKRGGLFSARLLAEGQYYLVPPKIKSRVRFEELSLLEDQLPRIGGRPGELDLVFCRNALIYFREETAREIVARLARSLRPGGLIVLSPCEAILLQRQRGLTVLGTAIAAAGPAPRPLKSLAAPSPILAIPAIPTKPAPRPALAPPPRAQPPAPSTAPATGEEHLQAFEQAHELLAEGQIAEAIATLRAATFLHPDFVAGYVAAAAIHHRAGRPREALIQYRRALAELAKLAPETLLEGIEESARWVRTLVEQAIESLSAEV